MTSLVLQPPAGPGNNFLCDKSGRLLEPVFMEMTAPVEVDSLGYVTEYHDVHFENNRSGRNRMTAAVGR